jgi:hypothetical protein
LKQSSPVIPATKAGSTAVAPQPPATAAAQAHVAPAVPHGVPQVGAALAHVKCHGTACAARRGRH